MKKILVTGGAGFIGSHLCEKLLHLGHEVICLDNFFTGSKENIEPLRDFSSFKVIEQDICDPVDLEVEEIYNLACPASPIHYQYDPIKTMKTSILGALNMLELAATKKSKIFQASTSEVYGDPLIHPQKESYWGNVNPIGIRSCYDEGKRGAETLFFDFHRQCAVPIKVGRIFNTYGPKMHPNDGRVVSNFIVAALRNEPITVYGDGLQTRSFCFVSDLVEAIFRFMEDKDLYPGPLNLGNPQEFTILELASLVLELTGSSSKIVYRPLPQDDPKQRKPDIQLAKEKLGWTPTTALKDGLIATIGYFEKTLSRFSLVQ